MKIVSDVDDVLFVTNFDYPNNSEDYIHRIGRTGRKVINSDAIWYFSIPDFTNLVFFSKVWYLKFGRFIYCLVFFSEFFYLLFGIENFEIC